MPLGWSNPSLVPCPPLIMHTPTNCNLWLTFPISNGLQAQFCKLLLVGFHLILGYEVSHLGEVAGELGIGLLVDVIEELS